MHKLLTPLVVAALVGCDGDATAPEPAANVEFELQTGAAEVGTQGAHCPGNVCWEPVDSGGWTLTGRVTVSRSSLEAEGPGAALRGEVALQERACFWSNCPETEHITTTLESNGSYGLEASPPRTRYLLSLYNGALIFEGDPVGDDIQGQLIWMASTGPNGFRFRAPFTMTRVPA